MASGDAVRSRLEAVWRIESAQIVAALTRVTGDLGLAEDAAQEAVSAALRQWPAEGIPRSPGAWLMAVARRRAVDRWRRDERLQQKYRLLARESEDPADPRGAPDAASRWDPVEDDVLRLVFVACHPVLSREARIALTLRVVAGLSKQEIARLFLVPVATIQQRIVRAKRTLAEARVPFEIPERSEWGPRLGTVLGVVYLLFTEGYAATTGQRWIRRELAEEALRLGRILTGLVPREPEALALTALMELQASHFAARTGRDGTPILLADQDRTRWDRARIRRGLGALEQADRQAARRGRGRGPYALQAAIAAVHAQADSVETTDWERIVVLYEALGRLAPSPVVELNRAVAVSQATGPETALREVDRLRGEKALRGSHLLPAVRAELLERCGRPQEAREEFLAAAALARNEREREALRVRAEDLEIQAQGA
ncbi:RNA polymerase sigma factor [Microbacterium sp. A93]|uniref:RNA polymerase sigma factor n=1 Tax=Microbacterium sp. A93 TaxID=3450716 RepID=UPI003F41DDB6